MEGPGHKGLVQTGEEIQRQYGIPIINKRIAVTPIAMIAGPSVRRPLRAFPHNPAHKGHRIHVDARLGGAHIHRGADIPGYRQGLRDGADRTCQRVYDKICRLAKDLVQTGEEIQRQYGIPIINNRKYPPA